MAYVCLKEISPEYFYEMFETDKPKDLKKLEPVNEPQGDLRKHFMTVKAHRYY